MSAGKILYAEQNGTYVIHMIGAVRFTISQGLDELIKQITTDENVQDIVVDLTEADYLDSTNFGLLAKIANFSITKLKHKPSLFCSKNEINTVLHTMSFEQAFNISDSWKSDMDTFKDITGSTPPNLKLLLEAHRNLSVMNPKNAERFHDVVELLEAETPPEQ